MKTDKRVETISDSSHNWEKRSTADIFRDPKVRDFIATSRGASKNEEVYAHVEFITVNEESRATIEELKARLAKKSHMVKKIAAAMNKTLKRKNQKIQKLLTYIKALENLLRKNNIDYRPLKRSIRDGEIHLASRTFTTTGQSSQTPHESTPVAYTDATEIPLDNEGNEITE